MGIYIVMVGGTVFLIFVCPRKFVGMGVYIVERGKQFFGEIVFDLRTVIVFPVDIVLRTVIHGEHVVFRNWFSGI